MSMRGYHKPEMYKKILISAVKKRGLNDVLNEVSAFYSMHWNIIEDFKELNSKICNERKAELTFVGES